tara:strand:+ start:1089 stop:1460 length:372 start_codon:yes stop_codon:yes gene_type:complete
MSEVIRLNRALNRIIAKEQALLAKMAADGGDSFKNEARLEDVQFKRREALASAAEAEYEESQKEKKKKDSEKKKKDAKERPAKSVKLKSLSNKGSRGGVGSPLDLSKGDMRRYAKTLGSKPLV